MEQHPSQQFVEGAFYAWRVDAPRTLLGKVAPLLLVAAVLAATLFPLAPHGVKICVVYAATGLLSLIFALSVVRLVLFVSLWVALGRNVWLFPNLYSEEIPITHILSPVIAESLPKKGEAPPSLGARLAFGGALAFAAVAAYRVVPEGTGVVSGMGAVNKGVLEMLNLHNGPKSISDGEANATSAAPFTNPTGSGHSVPISAAQAAAAAAIKAGRAGPAGVPVKPEERLTEEVIANLAPVPEEEEIEGLGRGLDQEGDAPAAGEGQEQPAAGGEGQGVAAAEKAEQAAAAETAAEL